MVSEFKLRQCRARTYGDNGGSAEAFFPPGQGGAIAQALSIWNTFRGSGANAKAPCASPIFKLQIPEQVGH